MRDSLTDLARRLRKESTPAEQLLWRRLRRRGLEGLRFRRQQVFGRYIVDFYCAAAQLVVEVDGDTHGTDAARQYDERRTRWLEAGGLRVLRVSNREVLHELDEVLEEIRRWALDGLEGAPSPRPPPQGEGGT